MPGRFLHFVLSSADSIGMPLARSNDASEVAAMLQIGHCALLLGTVRANEKRFVIICF